MLCRPPVPFLRATTATGRSPSTAAHRLPPKSLRLFDPRSNASFSSPCMRRVRLADYHRRQSGESGLATGCYKYTPHSQRREQRVDLTIVKVDTDNRLFRSPFWHPAWRNDSPSAPALPIPSRRPACSSVRPQVARPGRRSAPTARLPTQRAGTRPVSPTVTDLRRSRGRTRGIPTPTWSPSRRVDNTAPNTTIGSTPSDPSNNTTPTSAPAKAARPSNAASTVAAGRRARASGRISPALGAGVAPSSSAPPMQRQQADATASYTWTGRPRSAEHHDRLQLEPLAT